MMQSSFSEASGAAPACASCGGPIPPGAPFGQCPACLLGLGNPDGKWAEADMDLLDEKQGRRFGDYELLEEIARGGMGVVYRARQLSLGRDVAVKMILAGELATIASVQRFRNEAAAAARLDHPNIVQVYEIGQHDAQHFFSMRLVSGGRNIADWARSESPPPPREVARMLARVAHAVAFAHGRGVLHRDLKPSNILMDGQQEPQVTDFGLAKLTGGDTSLLTLSAAMLGSPSYMAPEQADSRHGDVTTATDVYGLGAVLFELLTGRPPFTGRSPLATAKLVLDEKPVLPPHVPRDLATICRKCLAKEPAGRYLSAQALAEDLERYARGDSIRARPVKGVEAAWRWTRRRPLIASLLAGLAVSILLGFAGVAWQWRLAVNARQGESRERDRATETAMDLYANAGLTASKDEDSTRAALWFATAAATPGASDRSRAANLSRWAAWRGDSIVPVRAFPSGMGQVGSFRWSPDGNSLILENRKNLSGNDPASVWKHPRVSIWNLPEESCWKPEIPWCAAVWMMGGSRLAVADGHTIRLLEYPSGREIASVACPGMVQCLVADMDEKWIGIAATAPFLWNPGTSETTPLPTLGPLTTAMEFSRDGKHLLITGLDRRGICDMARPDGFLFPPVSSLGGAARGFLAEGGLFLTHDSDGRMFVRNTRDGSVVESYPAPRLEMAAQTTISRDGRFIGRIDSPLIERPDRVLAFPKHRNTFDTVAFSDDNTLVASGSWDDTVRLWKLPEGGTGRTVGWHQEGVVGVAISPDNRHIATCQWAGDLVRIWRMGGPPEGQTVPDSVNARICLSKDGALIAASGRPDFNSGITRTRVRSLSTLQTEGPEILPGALITDSAFSPDGSWLAVICSTTPGRAGMKPDQPGSGTLELWDFRKGARLGDPIAFEKEPRAVAVRPDGKKIAVYGSRRTLWEIDVATRQVVEHHTNPPDMNSGHGENAECAWSPDGRHIFAWGLDQPALVWDSRSAALADVPEWRKPVLTDLDFLDGKVASGSLTSTMQILSLPHLKALAPAIRDTNWIFVTRFSQEGDLLLTAGRGRIGHVWDWRTGKLVSPALRHEDEIFGGTFLPGTECVVTAGSDRLIRFWDRRTGLPLRTPIKQEGTIKSLQCTPDGRKLLSDGNSGIGIVIHDVAALLPSPSLAGGDALLLAEIDASAEIHHGALEPLNAEAWINKWRLFRGKFPHWHQW